jgi:hypothetical protein
VPNGRFSATKCSWLHTMRKKSSWNQQHFSYKTKSLGTFDVLMEVKMTPLFF